MHVFLSYMCLKDQFNKVSQFRERLQNELELREPGSQVSKDKHNLRDGQHFPGELEAAIHAADVFLALVSPAWLQTEWCRREFGLFTAEATASFRLQRIVPVLCIQTPELRSTSLDLFTRTLAVINCSAWRALRCESWDEPQNQRVVGKLAENMIALALSPANYTAAANTKTPTYRFRYGVRWTDNGTPICIRCGVPITSLMWATHFDGQIRALRCSYNKLPIVLMQAGEPVDATDAMKEMARTS